MAKAALIVWSAAIDPARSSHRAATQTAEATK